MLSIEAFSFGKGILWHLMYPEVVCGPVIPNIQVTFFLQVVFFFFNANAMKTNL